VLRIVPAEAKVKHIKSLLFPLPRFVGDFNDKEGEIS